jgi:ABC-type glycerol-3-phosphate transport system permease component
MMTRRSKITQGVLAVFLCFVAIFYAFPYVWMVATSFKPDGELFDQKIFPQQPNTIQYDRLFYGHVVNKQGDRLEYKYSLYYRNSLIVTISSLVLVLTLDALAAFAFAKYEFKGNSSCFG